MKKLILLFGLIGVILVLGACTNRDTEQNRMETETSEEQEINDTLSNNAKTTISGSFTVCVRDIIPDYCMDGVTSTVAVVTEFQSYPFTVFVGEEIGSQLEVDKIYVFSIDPIVVDYPKEYLQQLNLSSIVWEFSDFEITDFRLANEDELGMESLTLTIE